MMDDYTPNAVWQVGTDAPEERVYEHYTPAGCELEDDGVFLMDEEMIPQAVIDEATQEGHATWTDEFGIEWWMDFAI